VRRRIKRGEEDELEGLLTSGGDGRELPAFGEERPVVELAQRPDFSAAAALQRRRGDGDRLRVRASTTSNS
jgi:hypothetical protein